MACHHGLGGRRARYSAERVLQKGRLQPGRMFLVDTEEGRIIDDAEIKAKIVAERPYRQWLNEYLMHLEDLPEAPNVPAPITRPCSNARSPSATLTRTRGSSSPRWRATGLSHRLDGQRCVARRALEPAAPAPDYFKQLFAQVTNPPIDCIREEIITSAETRLGSEGNLLHPEPTAAGASSSSGGADERGVRQDPPDGTAGAQGGHAAHSLRVTRGERGLAKSMEELCVMARRLIEEDEANVIILSDRGVTREFAPIPALLAIAGLHHYLIREGLRTRAS